MTSPSYQLPCSEVSGTTFVTRSLHAHKGLRDTCAITSHLYAHMGSRDTCITSHLYAHRVSGATHMSRPLNSIHFYKHIIICHELWLKSVNIHIKRVKCLCQRNCYYRHDFSVFYHKYLGFDVLTHLKGDSLHIPGAPINITTPILRGGAAIHKGRSANIWIYEELQQFVHCQTQPINMSNKYIFKKYIPKSMLQNTEDNDHILIADIPITVLVTKLSKQQLLQVSQSHYLTHISQHKSKDIIVNELLQHKCDQCDKYVCIFSLSAKPKVNATRCQEYRNKQKAET